MALFEIKNLSFQYPESNRDTLSNINFSIEQGEFVVICGKSGCGKTTLLKHLKSAMTPYGIREGEIYFCNEPLGQVSVRRQAAEIGYVFQNPDNQIVTDKVWHELAFGLENLGYDNRVIRLRVAEMAGYFGIQHWFYKEVRELSGGQKQLLNLASIMVMQPKVLILDESTSQLDPIAASEFFATLKKINTELGTTIIIIEHRLEEVFPMADKVLVLENGKQLLFDSPREVGKHLIDNELFLALPTPMQIFYGVGKMGECPLTVCEGRQWMAEQFGKKQQLEPIQNNKASSKSTSNRETKEIILEAKEVWFRYEKQGRDIVKGLSLQVQKGELFCILGGNGTGKSTTLSLLCGTKTHYRGTISIEGKNIKKIKKEKHMAQQYIAMLPQNPQSLFVEDVVEKELQMVFEHRKPQARELIVIAVMSAIAVVGRVAFFMLPQFKPMVAIVMITGICLGAEAGFLTGAMAGFVSNFFFGQGPWTPWQMFAYGVIGFLSGILFKGKRKKYANNPWILCSFGGFCAMIIYGILLDTSTVFTFGDEFSISMLKAVYISGVPFNVIHGVSTIIFLFVLYPAISKKLNRIKVKYGMIEP